MFVSVAFPSYSSSSFSFFFLLDVSFPSPDLILEKEKMKERGKKIVWRLLENVNFLQNCAHK